MKTCTIAILLLTCLVLVLGYHSVLYYHAWQHNEGDMRHAQHRYDSLRAATAHAQQRQTQIIDSLTRVKQHENIRYHTIIDSIYMDSTTSTEQYQQYIGELLDSLYTHRFAGQIAR